MGIRLGGIPLPGKDLWEYPHRMQHMIEGHNCMVENLGRNWAICYIQSSCFYFTSILLISASYSHCCICYGVPETYSLYHFIILLARLFTVLSKNADN